MSVTLLFSCTFATIIVNEGDDLRGGFLVGKNPFAIDLLATQMLAEAMNKEGHTFSESLIKSAEKTAAYVNKTYGIQIETPLERINI